MRFSQNPGEKNMSWYKSFSKGTRKNYLAGQKQLFPHLFAINYSKLTKKIKKEKEKTENLFWKLFQCSFSSLPVVLAHTMEEKSKLKRLLSREMTTSSPKTMPILIIWNKIQLPSNPLCGGLTFPRFKSCDATLPPVW